jgi:hypothetical protein
MNMAINRLNGNLDAFASAIEPPRKTSPQQGPSSPGGRKLAAFSRRPAAAAVAAVADPAAASVALGKKLLGTREDWSILQPGQVLQQHFTIDTGAIEAMATGEAHAAGRRLMQAVTSTPAAGGATTSTVMRPPVTGGSRHGTDNADKKIGAAKAPPPTPLLVLLCSRLSIQRCLFDRVSGPYSRTSVEAALPAATFCTCQI